MVEGVPFLKLVASQPKKPRVRHAGEPLECPDCKSRTLIEAHQPTYRAGRVSKGPATWLCPYCKKIVWP